MKYISIYSITIIGLLLGSCKTEEPIKPIDNTPPPCVIEEKITSTETDFFVYWKGSQENGKVKAIKFNEDWEASPVIRINRNGGVRTISFFTFADANDFSEFETEALRFFLDETPFEKGCYELVNNYVPSESLKAKSRFTVLSDLDAPIDKYRIDENSSAGNYLEIDSLSLENNYISGSFMASFLLDTIGGNYKDYNPINMRIFNGEFEAEIIE